MSGTHTTKPRVLRALFAAFFLRRSARRLILFLRENHEFLLFFSFLVDMFETYGEYKTLIKKNQVKKPAAPLRGDRRTCLLCFLCF
jgi:hypothetical protein